MMPDRIIKLEDYGYDNSTVKAFTRALRSSLEQAVAGDDGAAASASASAITTLQAASVAAAVSRGTTFNATVDVEDTLDYLSRLTVSAFYQGFLHPTEYPTPSPTMTSLPTSLPTSSQPTTSPTPLPSGSPTPLPSSEPTPLPSP